MSRIVLPGDFITTAGISDTTLDVKSTPKLIGHGVEKRNDGSYAVVPGVLNQSENKVWVTTSTRRYTAASGDRVLGIVAGKIGDYFRVDIGAPDLALLNFMSFEGATKRNKPTLKVGDLIYGVISITSKHLEPEISCVDAEARARGLGQLTAPGLLLSVPMNYVRRLMSATDKLISSLGAEIKFEIAFGMNGKIWISGGTKEVLTVKEAILKAETTFEGNIPNLAQNMLEKYRISTVNSMNMMES